MPRFSSTLLCLVLLPSLACFGQKPRHVKQEITWLRNSLLQHHVEPKKIDDRFSTDLFDKLVNDLDPDKIFFTKAELSSLEPYRHKLDDEINAGHTGFLTHLKQQFKSGLQRAERLITAMLASPLDWQKPEMYDPDPGWAPGEEELSERCRQWLKYQIFERLADVMERDSVVAEDFFNNNLREATDYVRLTTLRPITRLLKDPALYDNEVSDAFLGSMAGVFDPHSAFFSASDYDDFVGSLSTEDYFFGFMLDEDGKGNVVISALSPGGAAWKSGALHVSDILLAVRWLNEDAIDVRGMDIEDVNEILNSNPGDMLEMTIRTLDGSEKQVTLRKEKLESEQNVVQSFILQGDIRAGYIYLPDFYTKWDAEDEGGRCANDVAKEIIRLKKEGVDGIILDLRFNGGGSLFEARAMAGIFIDEGPLAMITTRDKKPVTLKDLNRGTVYDGPLVLMVNGQSASASEVLAASIQDYNRGLIVGSATYGKATGQNLFPIEGMPAAPAKKDGEGGVGYVKITTQKLFRVTGKSAQGKGVTPDIALPDIYTALKIGEGEQPFSLKGDSIAANPYYKALKPLKRTELQARSRERLARNAAFQELQQTIAWIEDEVRQDADPWALNWEDYSMLIRDEEKNQEAADSFRSPERIYEVSNAQAKEQHLSIDDYARELNHRWLDLLASDIYLQETYNVLRDHISLTKNP